MKAIMRLTGVPLLAILLGTGFAGCTRDSSEVKQQDNEVWMQGESFVPSTLTVPVNTTVKWTNKDGTPHTVTSDSGTFDSDVIDVNGTFERAFTDTGSFPYHCELHNAMAGTIVVQ